MAQTREEGTTRKEYIRHLITNLNNKDLKVSESAHLCLLTLGKEALPLLLEALEDPHKWTRWEALKTLVEMRNPDLAPLLTRELENNDEDVRWLAAEGLMALGKPALPPLLKALIERPKSVWLLQGAHHVLKDLYLGKLHDGESKYYALYSLDRELKQKMRPVLDELENDEPSLKLPLVAAAALDYLQKE